MKQQSAGAFTDPALKNLPYLIIAWFAGCVALGAVLASC